MAAKTTVVACSGNHDLNASNELGERSAVWLEAARNAGVFVDGARLAMERVLVTVCQWWDGPRTRELVGHQLAEDAAFVEDRLWIWVYHAPPDASPTSWTGKRHYGDEALGAWIEEHRPGIVLCGHVHESPFQSGGGWIDRIGSTLVLNAGRQRGPIPASIELDTDAGCAWWRSVEGIEEKAFAAV
jgi:hypothetical protein